MKKILFAVVTGILAVTACAPKLEAPHLFTAVPSVTPTATPINVTVIPDGATGILISAIRGTCPYQGIASESNNVPEPHWAPIKGPLPIQKEYERLACAIWAELRSDHPDANKVFDLQNQLYAVSLDLTYQNVPVNQPIYQDTVDYIRMDTLFRTPPTEEPRSVEFFDFPGVGDDRNIQVTAHYARFDVETSDWSFNQRFWVDPLDRVPDMNGGIGAVNISRICGFKLTADNYEMGFSCPVFEIVWSEYILSPGGSSYIDSFNLTDIANSYHYYH